MSFIIKKLLSSNSIHRFYCNSKLQKCMSANKSSGVYHYQNMKTIRTFSSFNNSAPISPKPALSFIDETKELMSVFPAVIRDLKEETDKYNSGSATEWFEKALQYNVPSGRKIKGVTTVMAYKQLVGKDKLTPDNIRLAQYLGWCVELLQAALVIGDDIVDESSTGRGRRCWYKLDNVGLLAINDILMIENGTYCILKKYFGHTNYYIKLVQLFHKMIFMGNVGQILEMQIPRNGVTNFKMDIYETISYNKSDYMAIYVPFLAGMYMAGFTEDKFLNQAKPILLELGKFMQIKNDYLDCFGDTNKVGKIGTDIGQNKCSWLAVVCMERASDDEKKIMIEYYGQKDPEKIAKVEELYRKLELPKVYALYENETYKMIKANIDEMSNDIPHDMFYILLDKIFKQYW